MDRFGLLALLCLLWPLQVTKGKFLNQRKHDNAWKTSKGQAMSGEFVSSANPDLKVLAFDENYDFNLPPPTEKEGDRVDVGVSLNLRNILEVS